MPAHTRCNRYPAALCAVQGEGELVLEGAALADQEEAVVARGVARVVVHVARQELLRDAAPRQLAVEPVLGVVQPNKLTRVDTS